MTTLKPGSPGSQRPDGSLEPGVIAPAHRLGELPEVIKPQLRPGQVIKEYDGAGNVISERYVTTAEALGSTVLPPELESPAEPPQEPQSPPDSTQN